jgi:uncharacterized protein YbbC (DUF1343 family)
MLDLLEGAGIKGAIFRPVTFEPVFDKYMGELCHGFQIHVTDKEQFKPYRMGLAILQAFASAHPDSFRWLDPPYEYEREKAPIDILIGSSSVRRQVESGERLDRIESQWAAGLEAYREKRIPCLLYGE